jgi:hypothetical protein
MPSADPIRTGPQPRSCPSFDELVDPCPRCLPRAVMRAAGSIDPARHTLYSIAAGPALRGGDRYLEPLGRPPKRPARLYHTPGQAHSRPSSIKVPLASGIADLQRAMLIAVLAPHPVLTHGKIIKAVSPVPNLHGQYT